MNMNEICKLEAGDLIQFNKGYNAPDGEWIEGGQKRYVEAVRRMYGHKMQVSLSAPLDGYTSPLIDVCPEAAFHIEFIAHHEVVFSSAAWCNPS